MRKLSKKISMLMVLAMLVSLFSGVVSASAASKWSFYDRTADEVVEVKDTYVMEKDQYANFDLYCEGEEADADTYSYYWESSDPDVVFVDKTNGRLRADKYGKAEAGDKAMISVYIDNKTTEKNENAKRSFYIEIAADEVEEVEYKIVANIGEEVYLTGEKYELEAVVTADGEEIEADVVFSIDGVAIEGAYAPTKAGEYTIVATATIDGEEYTAEFPVVVEESLPEIVDAKQVALNAVEIKLSTADWAKEFASKVKLSYFAGDVEIADLVKSAVAKEDVVTVTLYNNLAADVTYKFACEEHDCAATVKGIKAVPVEIRVVGGNVAAGAEGDLDVKFFAAGNIDITTQALKDQVQWSGTDDSIAIVAGPYIYFFEAGKSVVVNAKYDMGYDENGNKITDLTNSGLYYSVKSHTDSNLNGYATSDNTNFKDDLAYGNNVTISLSDNKYLHAKYTRTPAKGNPDQVNVAGGYDDLGNDGYTYYSTNESVVMVNVANGFLTPCSEGPASVYIKKGDVVVGSVAVTVKGARTLNSINASMTDRMVSASVEYTDATTVAVSPKDQLGDYIELGTAVNTNDAKWKVELKNPAVAVDEYFDVTVKTDWSGKVNGIELKPNANAYANIEKGKTQVVSFKITAKLGNVEKTYENAVTIKHVDVNKASSTVLDVSATSVDMKLNKGGAGDYKVTAKLVMKDSAGYDLGLKEFNYITSEADAVTENGVYSIIIKKNAETSGQQADGNLISYSDGNTVTFEPVKVDNNGNVSKTGKASYTIKVFKGDDKKAQSQGSKTVSFTDSTSAITAVVNKTNVNVNDMAAVKDAMDFYRGSTKINDKITVKEIKEQTINVNGKVYVKKITVIVDTTEMNGNFKNAAFEEDVVINQLFTIPQ